MTTDGHPAKTDDCRYLVRFDDLCPTMNWAVWNEIEEAMVRLGIEPILAVVPENLDPKLMIDPPLPEFWDRVRAWQARGWTIALHGYQHRYVNRSAGMLGLTPQSEFADLDGAVQEEKLRRGLAIFGAQGVQARAWVAPAHSFDRETVASLARLGIGIISDGLWPRPHRDPAGMLWIPQQLWGFMPRPPGMWTVCLHPNSWSRKDLDGFLDALAQYQPRMATLAEAMAQGDHRSLSLSDRFHAFWLLHWVHGVRPFVSSTLRRIRNMSRPRP